MKVQLAARVAQLQCGHQVMRFEAEEKIRSQASKESHPARNKSRALRIIHTADLIHMGCSMKGYADTPGLCLKLYP